MIRVYDCKLQTMGTGDTLSDALYDALDDGNAFEWIDYCFRERYGDDDALKEGCLYDFAMDALKTGEDWIGYEEV